MLVISKFEKLADNCFGNLDEGICFLMEGAYRAMRLNERNKDTVQKQKEH